MNIPMGVPFPTKVSLTLAYVVTFLLAIVGNSFIIHVVCRQHNMRTAFNYLIVNMAAADILDALVAMPGSVLYLFVLNRWLPGVLGTITCKFVAYAVSLSIVASVLTLTLIAIDRYIYTTQHFTDNGTVCGWLIVEVGVVLRRLVVG